MPEQSRGSAAPTAVHSLDLERLRSSVTGRVIAPGDEDYDATRAVGLGGVDDRPAAIVRVAGPDDIRAVLAVVRATGLELAVRAGGHSGAGHSTVDGGMVIDVRDLTSLEIDVAGRTAWVGAGLTAGDVTRSLAQHGMAIGFGDTGSVGAAGITLGGGMGYLVRKHGMTIDSLLAAEVVTASGDVITADGTNHPDLFWALRGGGGNFGVATRFRFRLQPLDRVVGGMLILPATVATITGFMAAAAAAPEELSTIANVMPCPPMPFVPEERHGEVVLFAMVCWSGAVEDGAAALEPLRSLAEPLADMVGPITYPEMYPPEEGGPGPLAVVRSMFMDGVDEGDARAIVDGLAACDAPMKVVQLRPLGGAMARVPSDATAFAHRDRAVMGMVAALYEGPEHRKRREAWVADLAATLRDGDGAYVNFLEDEGPARVREAYPGDTWTRLVDVKRRYDPDNVFHRNQNVGPGLIRATTATRRPGYDPAMQTLAIRLRPGQDLRLEVEAAARAHGLRAPIVLTCVGSLSRAALRMAGMPGTTLVDGDLEIISLVGTLSEEGPHLHLAVSDREGRMTGGHAQEGSIVRTTAEVVLGELEDVVFTRPIDPVTTYDELVVEPR